MARIASITLMLEKFVFKKKSRKLFKPARFLNLTVETPSFSELEDVESATPTDVISFGEASPRAGTPRVPNALKLPRTFPILSVIVPTESEKDLAPDLPVKVFEVFEGLPDASDWGATGRMAIRRLEHLRLLDETAYKLSVVKGLRTPMPPKLRA